MVVTVILNSRDTCLSDCCPCFTLSSAPRCLVDQFMLLLLSSAPAPTGLSLQPPLKYYHLHTHTPHCHRVFEMFCSENTRYYPYYKVTSTLAYKTHLLRKPHLF